MNEGEDEAVPTRRAPTRRVAALQPADMERHPDHLVIVWTDGHRSVLPHADLRRACRCATCRTERDRSAAAGPLRVLAPTAPLRAELADVAWVGRYAFRLAWRDGHDTGIYSFELLRGLCACEECRGARGGSA